MLRVLAVDLGATSARVAAVDLDARPLALEIVHRYPHHPVRVSSDGSLRWDWQNLLREVERGLELAELLGAPVPEICIIGGGGRNWLLNRLIEKRSGLPVRVGSAEATALGNALVQGIGFGRVISREHDPTLRSVFSRP